MVVNLYSTAAPYEFQQLYTPINLEAIMRSAALLKDVIDKAAELFNTQLLKWSDFQSPSEIDTQNWYNLTVGNKVIQDHINRMVSDPDALKDASFRASLSSAINNVDYTSLSKLKQSRDALLTRQKVNAELMMKQMYNPLWHDIDFANYDTLDPSKGIFSDVSPLPYMSVVDMVKPYVDNLKESFISANNGWITTGVSEDRTNAELMKNWSSIQNSPYYQRHLEVLQLNGLSAEEALDYLDRSIFTAGKEFAWENKERDPLALAFARKSGSGSGDSPMLSNLTDQLELAAYITYGRAFSDSPTEKDARAKLLNMFTLSAKSNNSLNSAINDVIGYLSYNDLDPQSNEVLLGQNTQTGKMTQEGWRVGTKSSDFLLKKRLAENIMNRKITTDSRFEKDFESGRFKHFFVSGSPSITTDGSNIFHNKYIYIPESDLRDENKLGTRYSARDYANAQGDWVNLSEDQVRITESTNEYGDTKTSTSTELKAGRYLRVPVTTLVPRQGLGAVSNDAQWAKTRGLGQEMRDLLQMRSEKRRLINSLGNE